VILSPSPRGPTRREPFAAVRAGGHQTHAWRCAWVWLWSHGAGRRAGLEAWAVGPATSGIVCTHAAHCSGLRPGDLRIRTHVNFGGSAALGFAEVISALCWGRRDDHAAENVGAALSCVCPCTRVQAFPICQRVSASSGPSHRARPGNRRAAPTVRFLRLYSSTRVPDATEDRSCWISIS